MTAGLRHERMHASGLDLHVVRAGAGPPVILLHGFPDGWRSWRHQIGALADAGFSVLAPDLRGYDGSDRPSHRSAYALPHLVADVAALVRSTGAARAHVAGHDWGGLVAWALAGWQPELVDRLAIVNAPHPRIFAEKVWRTPQFLRSSYVLFFALPWLPERVLAARDFAAVRQMLRRVPYRTGAFDEATIDECVEALAWPGALRAALDYYRENLLSRRPMLLAAQTRVAAETLVIWGERDPALGLELLDGLERVAPRARVHRIPDAGHWAHNEVPDRVNRLLVEFLGGETEG